MRAVRVVSISPAALEALGRSDTGEVHSVFERTFNILVDERLVGVLREGAPMNPINMVTDIPRGETMPGLGIAKAMPVRIEDDFFSVGGVVEFSLKGVEFWMPALMVENPAPLEQVMKNLEIAKRAAKTEIKDGFAPLLPHVNSIWDGESPGMQGLNDVSRKALPHILEFLAGVRGNDYWAIEDSLGKLVGLGLGLTPSADDFLSGFGSSLGWVSRSFGKGASYAEKINREIAAQAGKTNLLSRQLLEHATMGEVDERVEKLLAAVLVGPSSGIESLVEKVMGIGETSGVDMMVGLLLGLQAGLKLDG